jgi:hypothetical protein|nr:MAG TPA: hypothetical protein [Caudoviricetes sp.]DAR92777.1 MAG TPA: hypothetical protein [Caudoviricetes sp.]DAV58286.1 MAG TPA: hypothetical protein [Caudoviricetes sp.]
MPYQFIVAIVMMVISMAMSYYSAKRMNKGNNNSSPANPDIPTAEEGANIPVVFGTVLIKNPQVTDYFDPKTEEIKS